MASKQSEATTRLYQDQVRSAAGAGVPGEREKVRFLSSGTECVAWHYPGSSGACVIMAGERFLTAATLRRSSAGR